MHDSLRHIYDEPTLVQDPWTKIQRALDFLRTDILDKVPNTVQILVGQIHKAVPLTHLHQLEPAIQSYDNICRQLNDLGHPRADIDHKQILATYLSVAPDFQYLRDTSNNIYRLDTYAQSKIRVRDYICGVAMSKIASKGQNVSQLQHQISTAEIVDQTIARMISEGYQPPSSINAIRNSTVAPPYPLMSSNSAINRPFISRVDKCWNCRQQNPGHRTPQCPAPFCRPCMNAGEKTFEWPSILSPGYHPHNRCKYCRPDLRLPDSTTPSIAPSYSQNPVPYAHKRAQPIPITGAKRAYGTIHQLETIEPPTELIVSSTDDFMQDYDGTFDDEIWQSLSKSELYATEVSADSLYACTIRLWC